MIKFENWNAWQESTALVLELYQQLKRNADLDTKDQMLRSAVSLASTMDKFFESQTQSPSIHFLYQALDICSDLKAQLQNASEHHIFFGRDDMIEMSEKAGQISILLYKLIHVSRLKMHPLYNPSHYAV